VGVDFMKTTDFSDGRIIKSYKRYLLVNQYFGKRAFINFIGSVKNSRILDLGCGMGHFTVDLTRAGAACVGVDKSDVFINMARSTAAKEKLDIDYFCLNGADLDGIGSGSFDKVIMFQVLLNVPSISELEGIFKEAERVLKPKGELIFTLLHPLLMRNYKDNLRQIILPANFNYYNDGTGYVARHRRTDLKWMTFNNSHWSLGFIIDNLDENGFALCEIKEPKPEKDRFWKYFQNLNKAPHYLFIKAVK
jgi:2-polyprenyl-3-methyl-5-hydroxy-6-metoxy-1,4-benzoquinol methylase